MNLNRIIEQAKLVGSKWFSPGAKAFFNSHIPKRQTVVDMGDGSWGFVTSEQLTWRNGVGKEVAEPRRWTARRWDIAAQDVETIGDFQAHATRFAALAALHDLAAKNKRNLLAEAPGCDGGGPHVATSALLRPLDLPSGDARAILCRACYARELSFQLKALAEKNMVPEPWYIAAAE